MTELLTKAGKIVSEKAVLPLLIEFEKEVSEELNIQVFILDEDKKTAVLTRNSALGSLAKAEVRLLLREGVSPQEFKFNGECIISGFAEKTGFSGFSMKGKVFVEGSSVEISGRTNRYNVWQWGAKFRY